MSITYFVTGGAGFIGSHVVDRMITQGRVTVFDNFSSGRKEFLSNHHENKNLRIIEGDLLDLQGLTEHMKGHDVVVHLSANPDIRKSETQTDLDLQQGTIATYHVLEAMRRNGIQTIIFSSTSAVYGEGNKKIESKKNEAKNQELIPETHAPLLPISHYGASKLACEGMISAFCHLYSMRALIFRFANVVGKRGTHGIIYDFIQKVKKTPGRLEILGDGSQQKSYVLADDVADAMIYVLNQYMKQEQWKIDILNLATPTSITVWEITNLFAEEYARRTGKKLELFYTGGDRGWKGDVPKVLLDPSKLESLGWKASCTSREAVKQAIHALFDEQFFDPPHFDQQQIDNGAVSAVPSQNPSSNSLNNSLNSSLDKTKTSLQAVILTGGEGSRLGHLTENTPKPLISVGGKPVIEHLFLLLRQQDIRDVVLCSGRLADKISKFAGDGTRFGLRIQHSVEQSPLGTGGPLVKAHHLLHDDVIVMNGDVFVDMDLRALVDFHKKHQALATLVVHPSDHPEDSDVIIVDQANRVTNIIHKPGRDVDSRITNAGLCVLKRTALDQFLPFLSEKKLHLERDIVMNLLSTGRVYAYNTSEYLKDMGTPERLHQVVMYHEEKQQKNKHQNEQNIQQPYKQPYNIQQPHIQQPQKEGMHWNTQEMEQGAWILDRDGVINEEVNLLSTVSQFQLLPGAAEAIKILNKHDIPVVIATNQPVVARGLCTEQDVEKIHNHLKQELARYGSRVDAIYYCPHHPETNHPEANNPLYRRPCTCRKPDVGMFQQAANDLRLSLKKSITVGDSTGDILAGKNAGCTTILVKTGYAGKDKKYNIKPDYIEESLYHAVVHHVLKQDYSKIQAFHKQDNSQGKEGKAASAMVEVQQ